MPEPIDRHRERAGRIWHAGGVGSMNLGLIERIAAALAEAEAEGARRERARWLSLIGGTADVVVKVASEDKEHA